ncbi:hypothetical protein SUGI_1194480 [Cryptomeria japonica]|nr:hypothetical protein SUGI_1194480 [Cryptomeria japonica]
MLQPFLLFCVCQWACKRNVESAGPTQRSPPIIDSAGPPQQSPPSSPSNVDKVDKIVVEMGIFNYRCDEEEQKECVICLCEYEEDDKVVALKPCHHNFHEDCIQRWMQCKLRCPICNACPLEKFRSHAQNDVALQIPAPPAVGD